MKTSSALAIMLALFVGGLTLHAGDPGYRVRHHPNGDTLRVKVLTYNVLGGRNTDGARDLNRIAEVIKALDPDVVALQEVDRRTGRLQGVDLPAELAALTGMAFVFGRAMYYDGGEYGEAILSRFPIIGVTRHALPHRETSEPRAALAATIQFPASDRSFVFIGTHLDHLRSPEDRLMQVKEINAIARRYEGRPVILAGDLNAVPQSDPMRMLETVWTDAWRKNSDGFTFPADEPRRRIDYVLYRPEDRWSVVKTYRGIDVFASDAAWRDLLNRASDHLPLMAEFMLGVE
ncbi:MAG: endonuclease/exonuclease/phosphatase family protein [Rhodothermales bacterium]